MPQQPGMAGQGAQQCPFCQLVAAPDQTFNVHESEHFKAWLDINPRAKGHTMVVPKEHLSSMEELGEHVTELFDVIRIVAEKARNGLGAAGVSIVINDGEAAGQRLEHFYAQVFPRFEGEENEGAPAGAVFQPLDGLDESDLDQFSTAMEEAGYTQHGEAGGAATQMVAHGRGEGMPDPGDEDAEDEDSQEDGWDEDGAEFL